MIWLAFAWLVALTGAVVCLIGCVADFTDALRRTVASKADQREWLEKFYPKSFECKFCDSTITINLRHKEVTTVTKGHAPGCPMAPR